MLKPNQVKPFLNHPEGVVREFATKYFADSFSLDPELLPLILTYTRRQDEAKVNPDDEYAANSMLAYAQHFTKTQETFSEILERFGRDDYNIHHYANLLLNAGPCLLEQNLSGLNDYPKLLQRAEQLVEILHRPTSELWNRLLEFSIIHANDCTGEFDYVYGESMVRELATRQDLPKEELQRLVAEAPGVDGVYREIYLTMLAGELRDEAWIPILADKLAIDGDLICETASAALAKLGTPAVVEALSERFCRRESNFMLYAAPLFGKIKIKAAEDALLKLLTAEGDVEQATMLADSLCQLLSVGGIPLVQQRIAQGYADYVLSLEESLYCNCRINNIELPELREYRQQIQAERDTVAEYSASLNREIAATPPVKPGKIGRNDPCPCGSGKKYKKCCLK